MIILDSDVNALRLLVWDWIGSLVEWGEYPTERERELFERWFPGIIAEYYGRPLADIPVSRDRMGPRGW